LSQERGKRSMTVLPQKTANAPCDPITPRNLLHIEAEAVSLLYFNTPHLTLAEVLARKPVPVWDGGLLHNHWSVVGGAPKSIRRMTAISRPFTLLAKS
jgi:hypothetical protein